MIIKLLNILFLIILNLKIVFSTYVMKGITFTDGRYCPNVTYASAEARYSLD